MRDGLLLLAGALFLYLPGSALLVCLRIRSARVVVGLAPVITIALLQLIALLRWGLGTGLARTTLGVLAAVAVVAVVVEVRAGRDGVCRGMALAAGAAVRRNPAGGVATVALLATAVWLGMSSWLQGFRGLATPPQEHDTVTHTLVTAWIAHTGRAGPFEVMPTDLATGGHVNFYPAGLHTFAGLLSMVSGNPVSGLNATTALVIGLVGPVTLFAAAAGFEEVRSRPAFSALAALLSVTLYRPWFQLAHDAGILAYAMGLALTPALVVGVTAIRGRGARAVGGPVALGLTALGLFTVHPSMAVIGVVTLGVGAVVAALSSGAFREWFRTHLAPLGIAAGVAAVLVVPWVVASLSVAGAVAGYPEAPPSLPLGDVFDLVAGFNYGGFLQESQQFQKGVAVLVWIGLLGCLTSRRLWPLAAAWLFWATAALLYGSGHSQLPGLAQLGSVFYNSWARLDAVEWVLAPAVAGLGIAALAQRLAAAPRLGSRSRRLLAPLVAVLVAVAFLTTAGIHYADVNTRSVADRWGDPQFLRLAPVESQAFDYLAAHRSEVGRVLNNGNDGSTFLYVYDGIPVVNTYPEGTPQAEYGIYLMQHLDEAGTNPAVRCLLQRYRITHVIMSATSPPLLGSGFPGHWVRGTWFQYAPGFAKVGVRPQFSLVFANPDVLVFQVAPSVLDGHDGAACTADPAHPRPEDTPSASSDAVG